MDPPGSNLSPERSQYHPAGMIRKIQSADPPKRVLVEMAPHPHSTR